MSSVPLVSPIDACMEPDTSLPLPEPLTPEWFPQNYSTSQLEANSTKCTNDIGFTLTASIAFSSQLDAKRSVKARKSSKRKAAQSPVQSHADNQSVDDTQSFNEISTAASSLANDANSQRPSETKFRCCMPRIIHRSLCGQVVKAELCSNLAERPVSKTSQPLLQNLIRLELFPNTSTRSLHSDRECCRPCRQKLETISRNQVFDPSVQELLGTPFVQAVVDPFAVAASKVSSINQWFEQQIANASPHSASFPEVLWKEMQKLQTTFSRIPRLRAKGEKRDPSESDDSDKDLVAASDATSNESDSDSPQSSHRFSWTSHSDSDPEEFPDESSDEFSDDDKDDHDQKEVRSASAPVLHTLVKTVDDEAEHTSSSSSVPTVPLRRSFDDRTRFEPPQFEVVNNVYRREGPLGQSSANRMRPSFKRFGFYGFLRLMLIIHLSSLICPVGSPANVGFSHSPNLEVSPSHNVQSYGYRDTSIDVAKNEVVDILNSQFSLPLLMPRLDFYARQRGVMIVADDELWSRIEEYKLYSDAAIFFTSLYLVAATYGIVSREPQLVLCVTLSEAALLFISKIQLNLLGLRHCADNPWSFETTLIFAPLFIKMARLCRFVTTIHSGSESHLRSILNFTSRTSKIILLWYLCLDVVMNLVGSVATGGFAKTMECDLFTPLLVLCVLFFFCLCLLYLFCKSPCVLYIDETIIVAAIKFAFVICYAVIPLFLADLGVFAIWWSTIGYAVFFALLFLPNFQLTPNLLATSQPESKFSHSSS